MACMTWNRKLHEIGTVFFVLLPVTIGFADVAPGEHESVPARRSVPSLWLVSTRSTSYCSPTDKQTDRLKYWRRDAACKWQSSNLPELLATDDLQVTTLVYVHENRVTRYESFRRAVVLQAKLSRAVPPDRPFRLIVISWPADRIGWRPRPDIQAKAQRSEAHGYYLAWLLDQMNPQIPIGLFGNSFGPRMITTALHYLGGGSIHGRRLSSRVHPDRRPFRVALMAAALDAHWLYPGQRYGRALTQVDHMLVTKNPCDEVLRWYPRIYGRAGPHALGYVGVPRESRLKTHREKVIEWNVSGYVGSTHSWTTYEGSPSLLAKIVPHLFAD